MTCPTVPFGPSTRRPAQPSSHSVVCGLPAFGSPDWVLIDTRPSFGGARPRRGRREAGRLPVGSYVRSRARRPGRYTGGYRARATSTVPPTRGQRVLLPLPDGRRI